MLVGHEYMYTGEIHLDHWHVECISCGLKGATDIGPKNGGKRLTEV